MIGSTFHVDGADKEVERGGEGEHDGRTGGSDFGLNVGETAGGEKNADALADLVAVERLARFLREHFEQAGGIRNGGKLDGLHGASDIGGHRRKS